MEPSKPRGEAPEPLPFSAMRVLHHLQPDDLADAIRAAGYELPVTDSPYAWLARYRLAAPPGVPAAATPNEARYNAGQQCDMASGPCACGAWHDGVPAGGDADADAGGYRSATIYHGDGRVEEVPHERMDGLSAMAGDAAAGGAGADDRRIAEIAEQLEPAVDEKSPLEDAIDLMWRDIILRRKPNYGHWDYGGFAYRHILAEFQEVEAERADALARLAAERSERARLAGEKERLRQAARWLGEHATGTPVPEWVDAAVNAPPPPDQGRTADPQTETR